VVRYCTPALILIGSIEDKRDYSLLVGYNII
jgi:hypothetical protein